MLDEIGIDATAQLGAVPNSRLAAAQPQQAAQSEDDLTARLAALR